MVAYFWAYGNHSNNIHNSQKIEATQASVDGLTKYGVTHTVEYHSALKRREILTPAAAWTNLEYMMLSETSQSQKDHCPVISLL